MTRTFKTAWFHKQASKAKISDAQLCKAVTQIGQGQMVDLGGGVYKKRLDENRHRSSSWRTAVNFGSMSSCLQKKTVTTLMRVN